MIAYAECGTQGELDKVCVEEGVERIEAELSLKFGEAETVEELDPRAELHGVARDREIPHRLNAG